MYNMLYIITFLFVYSFAGCIFLYMEAQQKSRGTLQSSTKKNKHLSTS